MGVSFWHVCRGRRDGARALAFVLALLGPWLCVMAQGKITPVDRDDDKPKQPVLHYYDRHGNQLKEPVLFLATLDTVKKVKAAPVFPLFSSASVGVNFFDALMKVAGQTYASFDVHADVGLHNWFFPTVEAGIGFASSSPDGGQFHFKAKPSPYVKIGMNYNFLYKSNPDYQFWVGLRAGMAHTSYDVTDMKPGYEWYSKYVTDVYGLKCTSWYGEALAGLRVKIAGPISLGWSIRMKFFFSKARDGMMYTPWFVPGYGHSPLGGTFSIFYTIVRKQKRVSAVAEAVSSGNQ